MTLLCSAIVIFRSIIVDGLSDLDLSYTSPRSSHWDAIQMNAQTWPVELRYLRETRNAVVFIAVLAGVICLVSLIIGIEAAVQLSKVSSELGGSGSSPSSNCLSQGGSDPSC